MDGYTRRDYLQTVAAGSLALGAGGLIAACGSSGSSSQSGNTGANLGAPKRGGTLTIGFTGGGSGDTVNPLAPVANVDYARVLNLFDLFAQITPQGKSALNIAEEITPNSTATQWDIRLRKGITFHNGKEATAEDVIYTFGLNLFDLFAQITPHGKSALNLAEEITPNRTATQWDIRLRKGITFHNGKEATAEDVIYTFGLNVNPKAPGEAAAALSALDVKGMKKLDKYTARIPFTRPISTFVQSLATNVAPYLVPVGFNPKTDKPIGTGPFKYKSFTPGQQSTFVRNENYWQNGLPYVDSLVLVDYSDETAQANSLVSGQSDGIAGVSTEVRAQLESGGQKLLISNGGGWNPFTMRVDGPPFNDVRVRQAMRLIVDRKQMRETVFDGLGIMGNDVFGIFAPEYDHSLPQRGPDIEKAKSLLKAAGQENLTVPLVTSDIAQGVVNCAQVLAQQANAAGVKINLREVTVSEFFGQNYLKWTFAQDYWDYNFYLPQIADSNIAGAPFNETHWNDPNYTKLYLQAEATLDEDKRTQISHELQIIDYTQGAYIIPFFIPIIDAHRPNIGGTIAGVAGQSFNNYDFKHMWIS